MVHYAPSYHEGKRYEALYHFSDIVETSKFAAALIAIDLHYKTSAKDARRLVKAGLYFFLQAAWQPFFDSVGDLREEYMPWRVPSDIRRQVRAITDGVAHPTGGSSA